MNNVKDIFLDADNAYEQGDYEKAFCLFMQLAKMNDVDAMTRIALMYYEGDGVKKNLRSSIEWDKKAISAGSVSSLSNLAITYRTIGETWNARKYFEKAMELGDDDAGLELAKLYMVSDLETDRIINLLKKVESSPTVSDDSRGQAITLLKKIEKN